MARILGIALLPLLLASCNNTPMPPLAVGASAWPGFEPLFLAQQQGYLAGANMQLNAYAGVDEVKKAFREHKLQAAALPLEEALQLIREVPDLKVTFLFDSSNGADAVLTQPGIAELRQLQGRRVGMDSMERGSYFLSLAMRSAGMQAGQVQRVVLKQGEMEAAFRAHKVDALIASGTLRARLVEDGAHTLFDSSRVPGKLFDVLVVRDEDIGNYHNQLMQLVQAWQRALDFLHAQPEQATQLMARHEHMDAGQFGKAMQGVELLDVQHNRDLLLGDPPALGPSMDAVQHFLLERGLINMGADAGTLLDSTLLPDNKK